MRHDFILHIRCRRGGILVAAAFAVAAILSGPLSPAAAQAPASLFGRVADEAGAPVQNVAVSLLGITDPAFRRTVVTDAQGGYRFAGLRSGTFRLRADRLGFRGGDEREIILSSGERRRLDLRLTIDTISVEGLVVEGRRGSDRERTRFETEPGVTARVVEGSTLKVLPGLAEADVLRAIELLPGVVSTSDFSSAFHVRGGSADQNLFLLDGFPIFNPFHLGGLFGVFNADAVARAELLAGGFGAEHGGRVSSVLNVESAEAAQGGLEVLGGVSVLASRVLVRGPLQGVIGGEGGSWFLSGRRSYFDQLLRPVTDFPYHLVDLQGHASVGTGGDGRLSLTGYAGRDVLDLSNYGAGDDAESILRLRWNWGNRLLGLRYERPLGRGWVLDSRAGFSDFRERLGFVDFGDVRFGSAIEQLLLRVDLGRDLSRTLSFRTGAALDLIRYDNFGEAGGTTFFESRGSGSLGGFYLSSRWRPDDAWIVEPGLRVDGWFAGDTSHVLLSPRVAAKRFLGTEQRTAVKLALGRYTQFVHSLRNEELPISNDTWIVADRFVPPVISDQIQAGVEHHADSWSASLEAYHRTFEGVTELNMADDPNDPSDDLLSGSGRSTGLDLLLRRSAGRLTGWSALSLLRATRTLPDPAAQGWDDLPPEETFPPAFDRRLDLDLVARYELPRAVEIGLRWNYGSPLPYTRPVAQHFGWRHNALWGGFEPGATGPGGDRPPLYVVPGARNAQRFPGYQRLDLTARRTFERRWGSWTPYLQVLNVTNRRNVLFYFYNYDRLPPTRSGLSMFPILPAIGVEASFR